MLAPGTKIGKYKIVRHVHDGTIGAVYEVRQTRPVRNLALKLLSGQLVTPEWKHRFAREFDILKQLDHANIIKVVDNGEYGVPGATADTPYLVTELFDGLDLKRLVQSDGDEQPQRLAVDEATKIVYQAALGLEHAHARRIVHRDIKPANILWNRTTEQACVLDFGLAKDFATLDASLTFDTVGALGFASHHKIREPRRATFSDDIFSLGCVFYYLLIGRPPFWSENSAHELRELIRKGDYEAVRTARTDIPKEVAEIIDKMLDKGETATYGNCRYLLADFNRLPLFRVTQNKVLLIEDWSEAGLSSYQLLVQKVYGLLNAARSAEEIFARLTSAVGRTNSVLVSAMTNSTTREQGDADAALAALAKSLTWLCALANKIGVDLESSVWRKFPGVCPYCRSHHTKTGCSKATKESLDIWRLRELANKSAEKMPRNLRAWETMFANIYPATTKGPVKYLSRKLVEELGEVADFITRPTRRLELLRETGVDFLAFELADIVAWMCHCSNALRAPGLSDGKSALAGAIAQGFLGELCPSCGGAICMCDRELETRRGRLVEYRYLD